MNLGPRVLRVLRVLLHPFATFWLGMAFAFAVAGLWRRLGW